MALLIHSGILQCFQKHYGSRRGPSVYRRRNNSYTHHLSLQNQRKEGEGGGEEREKKERGREREGEREPMLQAQGDSSHLKRFCSQLRLQPVPPFYFSISSFPIKVLLDINVHVPKILGKQTDSFFSYSHTEKRGWLNSRYQSVWCFPLEQGIFLTGIIWGWRSHKNMTSILEEH